MLDEYERLEAKLLASIRTDGASGDFDSLAIEVHRFQRRWNRPFANFCATRAEPREWREIPAVPQSAFKHFALSVAPPELIAKVFHTSGTTGEGVGRHAFVNTRLYDQAVRAGWARLGVPELPHLVLIPRPADAPHSSLSQMISALEPLAAKTVWCLAADGRVRADFAQVIENVERRGTPVALLGTALGFLNAFEQLGGRRFTLPAGSFAMETGG